MGSSSKFVYVNPHLRRIFNLFLLISVSFFLWMVIFAFVFAGAFWYTALGGGVGTLAVWGLAELCGAYKEELIVEDTPDA